MSKVESLENKRAQMAWGFISSIKSKYNKDKQKEYKTALRKFPAMILTSGLGQTVAFHMAKEEDKPHRKIIDEVVKSVRKLTSVNEKDADEKGLTGEELVKKIIDLDHETYILLSKEVLKYTTWLKRFAEAELEG